MRVVRVYHAGRDAAHRERDRALVAAGVELALVVPSQWPGADELTDEPFEIVQLPVRRPGDVNRHRYADPDAIATLVRRLRPDVVDLHEEPFSAVVHQLLRRLPALQTVVSYAAQNIDKRFPPPFAQWERAALDRVQGIYPCSRQAASVVVRKGFRGALQVLPLGVAAAMSVGDQSLPAEPIRLLLVGRLVPEKGVLDAVRVLAHLHAHHPAELLLVGSGPEGTAAQDLAAELGVADRLRVEPWLTAVQLAERYRAAHIVLAPSRATRTWAEQFGRMVVEAQACGAVVAGYASGALPEVVSDRGVLVADGNVAGLGRAVLDLVEDPARWAELRAAGLSGLGGFSWAAVAAGQVDLYARAQAGYRSDVRDFGASADVPGGGRPFALPLLRAANPATRAVGRVFDSLGHRAQAAPARRLRVVYVDHVARLSGGELGLARLLAALPDVDAHVILAEEGPLRPLLEEAGAVVEVLPMDARARDLRRHEVAPSVGAVRAAAVVAVYTVRLAWRLRQLRPDLVHTNSLKAGYYGSIAARLARLPVIWHLRDRIAEDYLPARAAAVTRVALRVLPHIVVCNSAETLRTAGRGPGSSAVISSPVVHDPYEFPHRPAVKENDGDDVVGIVGRLAPWKGQDVFVRALAALRVQHPHVRGRIIGAALFGEDEYADSLQRLVAELGLHDAVDFTGFVTAVADELARLDVLVHASVVPEPFGQVVVEGMAAGLPVVASAAGGPAEIVTDGVDGLLVPPGDVDALARALDRLMSDSALRARLGEAAVERAKDFAPAVIGAQMQELYRQVLSARTLLPRPLGKGRSAVSGG